ncbi:MAG TPA: ketopantoate reductase family protein [Burkholderiaceae bacterium]|nr:ketopantoate reductase family protein [Burkholderiaceae bacterium]
MKILVLGAGGIGGMLGGRLAEAGADVTFLVRERREADLREKGLRVESPFGDCRIDVKTLTKADASHGFDLVLLTCKAYDLPSAVDSIAPAMGPQTAVLPLLNGMAHIEKLNSRFGRERVIGGTVRMQATLTPDGVVRQLNDWQTVTFGEQDGSDSARIQELKALFDRTPIEAKISSDILRELWMKLVHLSTVAGMTCLMRANLGEIVRTPEGSDLLKKFFGINVAIATHAGYKPDDKFIATYTELFSQSDSRYEASMLRDLEKGGPVESEQILGAMVALCREAGQADALHLAAYTHVKSYEQRRAAGRLPGAAS